MPSKCQQCDKVANYGLDEILNCGDRLPNEKNLRAKYCDECDRQASFGFLVPSKCDLCFYELNPTSERTINHNYKSSMINEMISLPDWAEIKLNTSKSSKKLVIRLNLDSYRKDGKLVKSCFVEQPSKSLAEGKPVKINKKKLNERIKLCLDEVAKFTSEPDNQIDFLFCIYQHAA